MLLQSVHVQCSPLVQLVWVLIHDVDEGEVVFSAPVASVGTDDRLELLLDLVHAFRVLVVDEDELLQHRRLQLVVRTLQLERSFRDSRFDARDFLGLKR